jgi:glycosyltransferase involved in cell wall biosynthesis
MSFKICFLVTDAVSFNALYRNQLEYMRDNSDFDITLICGGNDEQLDTLRARNIGNVVNLNFQRKPSLFKDTKSLVLLTRYFLLNRFDVVVYLTPKALLLGSIASAFTLQKRRIAFSVGRAYENFSGFKKRVFQGFDTLSFALSHEVLFVSESLLAVCLEERILKNSKATVIDNGSFNGIDIDLLSPIDQQKKDALREKYKVPLDCFLICVVGRVCEDKGLTDIGYISETLKEKNVHFIFIGGFEDNVGQAVVEKMVKDNRAVYIPANPNVHEIFQCADLHLFLSYREGFGSVAIEAASCGIPTFAYDVVGVKDSVKEGVSGQKFTFKDVQAVATAISNAATDESFKNRYPEARDWATANFEQNRLWQSFLSFYLRSVDDVIDTSVDGRKRVEQ